MTTHPRNRLRRLAMTALLILGLLVGGDWLWSRLAGHVQSVVAKGLQYQLR